MVKFKPLDIELDDSTKKAMKKASKNIMKIAEEISLPPEVFELRANTSSLEFGLRINKEEN